MPITPEKFSGRRQLEKSEVLSFIDSIRKIGKDDPQQALDMAQNFYDSNLAWSPSNVVMPTNDMLDLLAEARNVPYLQATLAHNLVGELGCTFGWAGSEYFE